MGNSAGKINGFITKKTTLTLYFSIKNPDKYCFKIIRNMIDKINKFDYISLDYEVSEIKNYDVINSHKVSLKNREEILNKINFTDDNEDNKEIELK